MENGLKRTRRDFLKAAALGAAGLPTWASSLAWGREAKPSANERIGLGLIGIGKMGEGHLHGLVGREEVQIVAVCDVWQDRRESAKALVEARYAEDRSRGTFKGCEAYRDFRELLARDDVDAVLIASPPHWHALQAIAAAEAGKDIYCEKPMARTIGEARAMVESARRYARVFQTGSQQRSDDKFRFACEMARSGRIGRIHTVRVMVGGPSQECDLPGEPVPEGLDWDLWLGPTPWRPYNKILCPLSTQEGWPQWRAYRDYDGGGMTDIGAHHFDIAQWGLGMDHTGPVSIVPPSGSEGSLLTYQYADGVTLTHGGGLRGIEFIGEAGQITVDRGFLATDPERLMEAPLQPNEVHLYESHDHMGDWFECIRARRDPICPAEVGCRSVSICHLGNLAYWLKRPLKWDPQVERFVDDEEANRYLMDSMRSPWRI